MTRGLVKKRQVVAQLDVLVAHVPHVRFTYTDGDLRDSVSISMLRQDWVDLGKPTEITVTIKPGNVL